MRAYVWMSWLCVALAAMSVGCDSSKSSGQSDSAAATQPASSPATRPAISPAGPAAATVDSRAGEPAAASGQQGKEASIWLTENRPTLPAVCPTRKVRKVEEYGQVHYRPDEIGHFSLIRLQSFRDVTPAWRNYRTKMTIREVDDFEDGDPDKPRAFPGEEIWLNEQEIARLIAFIDLFKAVPRGQADATVSDADMYGQFRNDIKFTWSPKDGKNHIVRPPGVPDPIVDLDALRKALVEAQDDIRKFKAVKPAADLTGLAN